MSAYAQAPAPGPSPAPGPPATAPSAAPATPAEPASRPKVEVSADAAAAAETLFQEGRALVEKQQYAEACPKFAESQRLDPGIGTLMNLGDCFEKAGKFASAWATYREAVAEANRTGQKQREKDAAVLAARVEPKLSRVVVRVPDAHVRPGLVIKRDGQTVDRAQWGTSIPIDAGDHTMSAEAPGHAPWSTKVVIPEASRQEVNVPALEALPEPLPGPDVDRGKSQRTIGFIVGGVGVAGLAAGGVLGLVAMNLRSDARKMGCDDVACATQQAKEKNDSALSAANISTVLFIAGGVVAATGIVLVATAPGKSPAPTAALRPVHDGGKEAPKPPEPSRSLSASLRGSSVVLEGRF